MHLVFGDVTDRIHRDERSCRPDPQDAAVLDAQEPHLLLAGVDQQIVDFADVVSVAVLDRAAADVAVRVATVLSESLSFTNVRI